MKSLILLMLCFSSFTWGIPEADFPILWKNEALPYFQSFQNKILKNKQNLNLRVFYKIHPENQRNLVVVPGRTEPAMKYAELLYDLRHAGFNVFILDHQGQGESQRLLKDPHKGHVIRFEDYVNDFELFIDQVIELAPENDHYLIAHSMGAAISVHFMAKKPEFFLKAVLVAPMFEMNTKPYSEQIARYFSRLLILAGRGAHYAPDRGPYLPEEDTFERNELTHSLVRFEASKYLFTQYPQLVVGGPTSRWVNQSINATRKIDSLGSKIKTPILLFQAGMDLIVKPRRQETFCEKSNCQLKLFPDSHHEITMEKDSIRDEALSDIGVFLGF